ncbi:ATP-grasp domain-containing protein [Streptomyces triticiradicis]|uniref:ATP-grasp domain-containing protein n=1 Tax=Streptomyces triticiradicis TaxID=2651189 RepID=UPI001788BB94|nr:ATP-grasp domain-containing protein [Streptomyces triticiradicis]
MNAPARAVLLTTAQETSTALLLAEAARRRGLEHVVLDGPDVVDALAGRAVHWYGGPLAADRVAARLGLGLLEPADAWLAELPEEFTGRRITLTTLSQAWSAGRPLFVKPPSDKQFPAAVYADGARLPREGERIGPGTPVLVSEVVTFAVEYRLFVLDGRVTTGSRYARFGRLDVAALEGDPAEREVRVFTDTLLRGRRGSLPSAVVVDVGLSQDPDTGGERWAVVEANMPWFAHGYAADPDRVLEVVLRAAGPRDLVAPGDRGFLRTVSAPAGAPDV